MEANENQHPSSSQEGDSVKRRNPLENLSKEELIAKCKGLLGLAQKAKQAKDDCVEKNKSLLNKLSEYETQKEADKASLLAMKEIVENLTQTKLALTSKVADLEVQNKNFSSKIIELETSITKHSEVLILNETLKRQLERMTDENEDLIGDLEKLETKFLQNTKDYAHQQSKNELHVKDVTQKMEQLEKTISELLEENLRLKETSEKQVSSDEIKNHLESSTENEDIKKMQTQNLELSCEIKKMKIKEVRLLDEIQHLKNKINDVVFKFKKLKECRKVLMENEVDYSESVSKWQEDIRRVSQKLLAYIRMLENDKNILQRYLKIYEKQKIDDEINYLTNIERKTQNLIKICDKVIIENQQNSTQITDLTASIENHQTLNDDTVKEINIINSKIVESNKEEKNEKREENNFDLKVKCDELEKFLQEQVSKCEDLKNQRDQSALILKSTQDSYNNLKKEFENVSKDIENHKEAERILKEEISDLIENSEHKNLTFKRTIEEKTQIIERLKAENAELLNEMRELNEALKGRGDVISRQQNTISCLEVQLKKISTNENENLSNESKESNNTSKQIDQSCSTAASVITDNQSEILSLCSTTKAEDSKRMQDVNECLEEKYNKLKVLAVKMKRKIQEQKLIITKYENSAGDGTSDLTKQENVESLEKTNISEEIKGMNDKINESKNEIQLLQNAVKTLNEDIHEKNKALDNEIKLRKIKEQVVHEKSNEIKILKQEKDAFNLIRKELEKEKDLYKNKLNDKEKEINKLNELLEKLKKDLEKSKAIGKQSSVLNLEIEAYERSLNENTEKLNAVKSQNQELMESVSFKESAISSLKQEIKLLEDNVKSEKTHSAELKQQVDAMQMRLKQLEYEKSELQSKLQDNIVENESKHSQIEELRLQISDISAKKDKLISDLNIEKENICKQLALSEDRLSECDSKLKLLVLDLENVRKEYASYKIRAQSILRENQNKETSRERELEEELTTIQANFEAVNVKFQKNSEIIDVQERKIMELKEEKEQVQNRAKEIMDLLEESREQYDLLLEENRKQSKDYQESLKAHRLQIETLTNCYKDQIVEIEQKHSSIISEITKNNNAAPVSRIGPFGSSGSGEQSQKSSDEQKVEMLLMEREDAEGSEASYTLPKRKISTRSKHDVIPLDELLNSSFDDNVEELAEENTKMSAENQVTILKEKLQSEETKNKHLTSLLSETEQDLIKYTQLSEILKEELRRHERTLEREKHMHNSEYLKNVIIKFLTLSSGDERTRLVPVLNTILRLSPDETTVLQNVAKGSDTSRSWNLLPIWSSNNN
ncbi:GRIP and coiled-coil domain-containing protein 2-like [Condylostylus longicornis]|uniref:GRIP and coiled-coil domain-containing protein 2-like n=1 Tax=Condylostylus longicornis TaxID=2530218 RepID=UPI00244DE6C6|nr:GRIP and coiled-coil domain-containing protein 2-like [Condylostylus longicornis]